MSEDEIHRINRQLEKMLETSKFDESIINDLLNILVDSKVTLAILTNTNIGKTLNLLRRHTKNAEVNAKAKNLLKEWKKLIPSEKASTTSETNKEEEKAKSSTGANKNSATKESKSEAIKSNGKPSAETKKSNSGSSLVNLKANATSDSVRLKCQELLANALSVAEIPDGAADPSDLAARIEEAVFREFKDVNEKYRNRIRSRVSNLKDLKNPELRRRVLLGMITPDRMAVLTAEEMASDSLKNERNKLTNMAINEYQLAQAEGTVSDLLQCKKCKQKKCSYTELQTRSADEPMTVFAHCLTCGYRWKS